jgi:hypothetical protein
MCAHPQQPCIYLVQLKVGFGTKLSRSSKLDVVLKAQQAFPTLHVGCMDE